MAEGERQKIKQNALYREDVEKIAKARLPWEKLKEKTVLIAGATGMIGSFLVDVLMYRNQYLGQSCAVYALSRDENAARNVFTEYWQDSNFCFVQGDVNSWSCMDEINAVDFLLHLASNTHPISYATDPIGTITTNIIGTDRMLQFATGHHAKRFLFASSVEIYGENRGDTDLFREDYCGHINCSTLRAGYPESKRCGEALCQAYRKQTGVEIVIPRLARTYGPTMRMTDTKAISQFIKNGLKGEDIILKSEGNQMYSYTYVADAVSGLLTVLLKGKDGEAYNVAGGSSDITLKNLALLIAGFGGVSVKHELPDATEQSGYSTATVARMDGSKLKGLGWEAEYSVGDGVKRTLDILKS